MSSIDADRIEQAARDAFGGGRLNKVMNNKSRRPATNLIKKTFGDLGKCLGYLVAASGYSRRDWEAWLYDMVWYRDDPDSHDLVRMPMVLESELDLGRTKDITKVNPDFQKLVQARADVRVWLAPFYTEESARQHIANSQRQARAFAHSVPGDTYIFITCIGSTQTTQVERFQV